MSARVLSSDDPTDVCDPLGGDVCIVAGRSVAPERIRNIARIADAASYRELWLSEDYLHRGGISSAALALGASRDLAIGLGIVSALVRAPGALAMEIATLARVFPGRVTVGIGVGAAGALRRMGLNPRPPLAVLREYVANLAALLAGEEVSFQTASTLTETVTLSYVPVARVPIFMGVKASKGLQLSGEIADGTIIGVGSSAQYVRWAREQISIGESKRVRERRRHRVVVYAIFSCDHDSDQARRNVRPLLASYLTLAGENPYTDVYGSSQELNEMIARGGCDAVEREMPDRWIDDLAIAGDPLECMSKIRTFLEAGAETVALHPSPPSRTEELIRFFAQVLRPRSGR